MPYYFAIIHFFNGTSDSYGSSVYSDAYAWARRRCGKLDLAEVGVEGCNGSLFRKVRGHLVAASCLTDEAVQS